MLDPSFQHDKLPQRVLPLPDPPDFVSAIKSVVCSKSKQSVKKPERRSLQSTEFRGKQFHLRLYKDTAEVPSLSFCMSFEVLCRLPTARAARCRIRIRPSFHNLCCRNSARSIHAAGLVLSGHNKWSTIKHKKGTAFSWELISNHALTAALDEVKQATYNKLSSRITLAVKCILHHFLFLAVLAKR